MIQLTEEQRRALQRIRKRYAAFQAGDNTQEVYYGSDVKTLLALLDSDSQVASKQALDEMREMGFMRTRIERIEVFDSASLPSTRLEISIWRRDQSGKVIRDSTLDGCMAQVRKWNKEESNAR